MLQPTAMEVPSNVNHHSSLNRLEDPGAEVEMGAEGSPTMLPKRSPGVMIVVAHANEF